MREVGAMAVGLIQEIWHTFDEAAIYILFGIFIAALMQTFIDKEKIAKYLGKRGTKSVTLATLIGIPLPLCSCGVIPMAVSLKKNGASKGAVVSFLISTPESSVNSIAMSYAMLDPLMTFARVFAAFFTAMTAGIAENIFGSKEPAEPPKENIKPPCCCSQDKPEPKHSLVDGLKHGIRFAFVELLGDITKWLTLGIVIGGIISYFIPPSFIQEYLGSGWQAMVAMLLIGIPLYICASASTPIAAALIAKGMSPGVALVFLLAGPATNMAGILTVGKFLGKRSTLIYLAAIAVCTLLMGLLLNYIYAAFGIDIKSSLGHACDIFPAYIKTFSSLLLIALMINAVIRQRSLG